MENQNVTEMSEIETRQAKARESAAKINALADLQLASEQAFGGVIHSTHESGVSVPLTTENAVEEGERRAKRDLRKAIKVAADLAANPDPEAIAKRRAAIVAALSKGQPLVKFAR
jgi:hypothetical protein